MFARDKLASLTAAVRQRTLRVLKQSVTAERLWSSLRPTISYSQFGEDVYLKSYYNRLAYERGINVSEGQVVDIGAFRPFIGSNSYFFYKRGWCGINIDPTPGFKRRFDRARPRDTNLEIGISPSEGMATFYLFGLPSVYNTFDRDTASTAFTTTGITPVETKVPVRRLESVLKQYLKEHPFEVLLIDAEGYDIDILHSNDFERFRPRIILIEVMDATGVSMKDHALAKHLEGYGYRYHAWLNPSFMFVREDSKLDW